MVCVATRCETWGKMLYCGKEIGAFLTRKWWVIGTMLMFKDEFVIYACKAAM